MDLDVLLSLVLAIIINHVLIIQVTPPTLLLSEQALVMDIGRLSPIMEIH